MDNNSRPNNLTDSSEEAEINFQDRRPNDKDPEITYKENESKRDHARKNWALIALMVGFFLSICLDAGLFSFYRERWVTEIFVTSLVPILAFILGTNTNNK